MSEQLQAPGRANEATRAGTKRGPLQVNTLLGAASGAKGPLSPALRRTEEAKDEGQQRLEKAKADLDETIRDLDAKLNRVLAKQEYDYLKGYNIYVKRKEKELRELILRLSERSSNATFKDDKLLALEQQLQALRGDQQRAEKQHEELRGKLKHCQAQLALAEQEKAFLAKQAADAKRKNKLLKLALGRLGQELEPPETHAGKSQFFLTDVESRRQSPRVLNASTNSNTLLENSLLEASTAQQSAGLDAKHKRHASLHAFSRYARIPTENLKFEKFVDLLFAAKTDEEAAKRELKAYMQALETHYTEALRQAKTQAEKAALRLKQLRGQQSLARAEKTETEALFVECVEEVRKEVMRRRLRTEIALKKKELRKEQEAREFEESLLRLAALAKHKIKFADLTATDKYNLLDLFVNNEKILVKMYEALFPHRVVPLSG